MNEAFKLRWQGIKKLPKQTKIAGGTSVGGQQIPSIKMGMKKNVDHFTKDPEIKIIIEGFLEMRKDEEQC